MRMRKNALLVLVLVVAALVYVSLRPGRANAFAVSTVSVSWGDSTALASWTPVVGATSYQVSLVRQSDQGIMEQFVVLAPQTVADAQGLWPNEQYFVAVAPIDSNGNTGPATESALGEANTNLYGAYNGFMDKENVADGPINSNLWDVRLGKDNPPNQGGAFVNPQLHYHLLAADENQDQTFSSMRARVPVDWTNRTATIHGEVDMSRADFFNWFAVVLSPTPVNGDAIVDNVDRQAGTTTHPMLELFGDENGIHLFNCQGGQPCQQLGAPFIGGTHAINVRDDIVWQVSSTHLKVVIDGQTAFNVDTSVSFTHAYLSLVAENYPGNTGGAIKPTACDVFGGACVFWHLDNWGFDAASGVMPNVAVSNESGCGPAPSAEPSAVVTWNLCGRLDNTGFGWNGQPIHLTMQAQAGAGQLVLDAQGLHDNGDVEVSVNGHTPILNSNVLTDRNTYAVEEAAFSIPSGELVNGANVLTFIQVAGQSRGTPQLGNIQIEQVLSTPFVTPPLPPEPAPIGTWGNPPPAPTPTQTSIPPSPTPLPINNVPCTVTLPTGQETGTCSGTFTPGH